MRPRSIVIFDICFLAMIALGVVNMALVWTNVRTLPGVAQLVERFPWYLPVTFGFGLLINLTLWLFVSRRASVVAKWILVVFFALSTISVVFSFFRGIVVDTMSVVRVVTWLLYGTAVWQLFTADARAWFAAKGDPRTNAALGETFS